MANSWMQHPVGCVILNGRAELADFWAIVTHLTPTGCFCVLSAAPISSPGFFGVSVSAYHLLRGQGDLFVQEILQNRDDLCGPLCHRGKRHR
jgi:cytochrome bd-type quinol oxidase subunit 1